MKLMKLVSLLSASCALAILGGPTAHASSHSDAPLIKLDPQANLTSMFLEEEELEEGREDIAGLEGRASSTEDVGGEGRKEIDPKPL